MADVKTITEQLDEIFGAICDRYCKYPDVAKSEAKDVDYADDLLYDKYCRDCPLTRI